MFHKAMRQYLHIGFCLAVAAQGSVAGSVTYTCLLTGGVFSFCCCENENKDPCPTDEASLRCCDVTMTNAGLLFTAKPSPSAPDVTPVLCAAAGYNVDAVAPLSSALSILVASISESPPEIYLVNHSFRC